MADAVRSMTTLNEGAARAALAVGVSAATDVTGFGLLGHLGNMLAASKVGAEIAFESLPILPHALEPRRPRHRPGRHPAEPGGRRAGRVGGRSSRPTERILCVDAQTSGGLLLAVPPENEARAAGGAARGGDAGGGGDRPARRPGRPGASIRVDAGTLASSIDVSRPLDRRPHGSARARRPPRAAGGALAPRHRVHRGRAPGDHRRTATRC